MEAEVFWRALAEACAALWRGGADPGAIAGSGSRRQRGTIVPVDRRGCPLRPAILWLDKRRRVRRPRVGGMMGLAFPRGGRRRHDRDVPGRGGGELDPPPRARDRRQDAQAPPPLRIPHAPPHGALRRLVGCQVGYLPFDYKRHRWASSGDWKWKAIGVALERLPELVPVTERLGSVHRDAAEATGLERGPGRRGRGGQGVRGSSAPAPRNRTSAA